MNVSRTGGEQAAISVSTTERRSQSEYTAMNVNDDVHEAAVPIIRRVGECLEKECCTPGTCTYRVLDRLDRVCLSHACVYLGPIASALMLAAGIGLLKDDDPSDSARVAGTALVVAGSIGSVFTLCCWGPRIILGLCGVPSGAERRAERDARADQNA